MKSILYFILFFALNLSLFAGNSATNIWNYQPKNPIIGEYTFSQDAKYAFLDKTVLVIEPDTAIFYNINTYDLAFPFTDTTHNIYMFNLKKMQASIYNCDSQEYSFSDCSFIDIDKGR